MDEDQDKVKNVKF